MPCANIVMTWTLRMVLSRDQLRSLWLEIWWYLWFTGGFDHLQLDWFLVACLDPVR